MVRRMADPTIVLLIIVGLTAAERPRGSVVSSAVGAGLGTNARVLVEERTAQPTDADATSTADRLGGSAIAEISWADSTHSRARLHVYLVSDRSWYDEELAFEASDAAEDRERSVGLLVGAMIRARQADEPAPPAPPPPPPSAPPLTPPPAEGSTAVIAPASRMRFGFDVGGFGMAGIGGEAPGLGPALRARLVMSSSVSLHGGAALGFGSLPDAAAHMTTTRLAFGGRWRFPPLLNGDVAFDVGLEAIVVHHAVSRTDPEASRDRWLPGGHLDGGLAWSLGRALELYATLGADAVLGVTPITLAGQRVGQIPPVRGTAEIGARILF